jgi:hypothetical protein
MGMHGPLDHYTMASLEPWFNGAFVQKATNYTLNATSFVKFVDNDI